MLHMWIGIAALIIGLALLSVAGYEYYEKYEGDIIPSGIQSKLFKYKMWMGIGGVVLLLIGIALMLYHGMEKGVGGL